MTNDTAVFLRLPTDLNVKLHDIARSRGGRKFSKMVREILEKYVEEHEKVTA